VTDRVRDWLPAGAVSSERVRLALRDAVESWSSQWFSKRKFNLGRVSERSSPPLGAEEWQSCGEACALRCTAAGGVKVLEAAIDLTLGPDLLTPRDHQLMETFRDKILDDLIGKIEEKLGLQRGRSADTGGSDWLQLSIVEDFGPDLVLVALPSERLTSFIKTAIPRKASSPNVSLKAAIQDESITMEALLGCVELLLSDLAALEPGDLLLLPTGLDQAVPIQVTGSNSTIAMARVSDLDGELVLTFASAA
jgi:hypothetical protein